MNSSSNAHKRQKLGIRKYSNSKVLSGITVRYGASGELTFEAHRLLLSVKSRWFEAAFTGGFAESDAREITLIGDDPDALKAMFNYAYKVIIRAPEDAVHGATTTIDYLLGLYRVGDKYDFPEFRLRVVSWFKGCMYAWLNRSGGPFGKNAVALQEFCGFVKEVYNLVGSEHKPDHPLVRVLLDVAYNRSSASILNNTGRNQPLITMASREVAEFGRDILLHLMAKTGPSKTDGEDKVVTTELCIGVKVMCLGCDGIWWRVVTSDDERATWCPSCERHMVDWTDG